MQSVGTQKLSLEHGNSLIEISIYLVKGETKQRPNPELDFFHQSSATLDRNRHTNCM